MPSQALVTHLSKADAQRIIQENNAKDLLSIQDGPDDNNFLVCCAAGEDGRNKPGAAQALQKIADADSKLTQAAVKKAEAEAAAKAAGSAKPE